MIRAYEDDGDGALAGGETIHDSDTTDSNGDYSLSLDPGDYVVCEVAQTGWTQSAPANTNCAAGDADLADGGHAELGVTSGQQLTDNHFGNFQDATKTGTKFNDLDGDGTKDGGEPGLENWVIRAYEDDGDGALAGGETIARLRHHRLQRRLLALPRPGRLRRLRGRPDRLDPVGAGEHQLRRRRTPTSPTAATPSSA